jgi:hypothetical protein
MHDLRAALMTLHNRRLFEEVLLAILLLNPTLEAFGYSVVAHIHGT